jgi:hypothetical protein
MRAIMLVFAAAAALAVAGCVSSDGGYPAGTVQATSEHDDQIRDELWRSQFQEREKKLHEGAGETPSTPELGE